MIPLRVAEGTTIHSLQGINVGANKQVKRLGIDYGKKSCEQKMPGLSLVAQSRPQSESDFCFTAPVTLDRLAVCGASEGASKLREAEAAFATQAARSDALGFSQEEFENLLRWAETYSKREHNIDAPWRSAGGNSASTQAPVYEESLASAALHRFDQEELEEADAVDVGGDVDMGDADMGDAPADRARSPSPSEQRAPPSAAAAAAIWAAMQDVPLPPPPMPSSAGPSSFVGSAQASDGATSRFFAAAPLADGPESDEVAVDQQEGTIMHGGAMADWSARQARKLGKRRRAEEPNALGGGRFHE